MWLGAKKLVIDCFNEIRNIVQMNNMGRVRKLCSLLYIIVFGIIGMILMSNDSNRLFNFIWGEENEQFRYVIGIIILLICIFFLCYFFAIVTKNYKIIMCLCICGMMPFFLLKRFVDYILIRVEQKKVMRYIPEFFVSFSVTVVIELICMIIMQSANGLIDKAFHIQISDKIVVLIVIMLMIASFFVISEKIIRLSIRWSIWEEHKLKIKDNSNINIFGTLNKEDMKAYRKKTFEETWKSIKKELEITKIYFFVIVIFIMLCIPYEKDKLGNLFANQFFGIATLAALMRETRNAKQ